MIFLYIFIQVLVILLAGIRIVRPTQHELMEWLGKYNNLVLPGFHWIGTGQSNWGDGRYITPGKLEISMVAWIEALRKK